MHGGARACLSLLDLRLMQGRADLAMAILLRLGRPDILPFIEEHGLFQVGSAGNDHFAGCQIHCLLQICAPI